MNLNRKHQNDYKINKYILSSISIRTQQAVDKFQDISSYLISPKKLRSKFSSKEKKNGGHRRLLVNTRIYDDSKHARAHNYPFTHSHTK